MPTKLHTKLSPLPPSHPVPPLPVPRHLAHTTVHCHMVGPAYNMDLATLSSCITAHPSLQSIPFDHLLLFLSLIAPIKSNITLIQPSDHPLASTPNVLLQSAPLFLSHACGLSINTTTQCWLAFKDLAWCSEETRALL